MIANLAEFRNTRRRTARVRAADRPCNDNHPIPHPVPRQDALTPHPIKSRLAARWHKTPAGKVECEWHVETVAE
jgi:hypothetical protein